MGGGPESRCIGRVYDVDGAVAQHHPHCYLLLGARLAAGSSIGLTNT